MNITHVLNALADVGGTAGRLREKVKYVLGEEVAKSIDVAHAEKPPLSILSLSLDVGA
jgi:hypothetical protein